jgi:hypothetical protein
VYVPVFRLQVHVWDSENARWVPRQAPCTRLRWETDSEVTPDCDPLNEDHTDPPLLSDMTYQRWYPTAVALPDGRILVLSGTDQNSSLFRDGGNDAVSASKIMQVTPEVYDPVADRTVALESARKHLNTFPRSFVVQTGPCKNDWKVSEEQGAGGVRCQQWLMIASTYACACPCVSLYVRARVFFCSSHV